MRGLLGTDGVFALHIMGNISGPGKDMGLSFSYACG
jgi:hypothetical protein